MIKVIIVEDNEIIKYSLRTLVENTENMNCVGDYTSIEKMQEELEEIDEPNVALLDIKLPGLSGIDGASILKSRFPNINILMLTIHDENDLIFDALCAGATGYLIKKTHPLKIIEAIEEASEGGAPMTSSIAKKVVGFFQKTNKLSEDSVNLTEREQQILKELTKGKTYYTISQSLNISKDTVRFHIKNIYKKLHVHTQAEAVAEALKKGLV